MTVRFLTISLLLASFPLSAFCQSVETPETKATCPEIEASGQPAVVIPGETGTFAVDSEDFEKIRNLMFEWSVDKGVILSGNGTVSIVVGETEELHGEEVKATVIVGGLPEDCENSYTASLVVSNAGDQILFRHPYEFGRLAEDDIRARVDNLIIRLKNLPDADAYLVSYGSETEVQKRKQLITDHLRRNKFPLERIIFVDGGRSSSFFTRVWIVSKSGEVLPF